MKKRSYPSNYTLITIAILILLFAFAALIIRINYKELAIYENTQKVTDAQLLSEMQANTLVITGLAITVVSIILTLLTLIREKRLEVSYSQLEAATELVEKLKGDIRTMIGINAVQTLQSRNSGFFFDAIKQYIEENPYDDFNHSLRIELIGISATIAQNQGDITARMQAYESIVKEAEKVVDSSDYNHLEKQFAYLELLDALYQRARYFRTIDYDVAKQNIDRAKSYIRKYSVYEPSDSSGMINNLFGLIYLWGVLPEGANLLRNNPVDLDYALQKFQMALDKNETEPDYKNNLAMAYTKRYELYGHEDDFEKAETLLTSTIQYRKTEGQSFAPRACINLAGLRIKRIQRYLGIDMIPISISLVKQDFPNLNDSDLKVLSDDISIAYANLITVTSSFPDDRVMNNALYKIAELLTYYLLIKQMKPDFAFELGVNKTEKDICKTIEDCFDQCKKREEDLLGCLYCERNYYELIGSKKALEINAIIKEGNKTNASVWENIYFSLNERSSMSAKIAEIPDYFKEKVKRCVSRHGVE